MTIRERAEQTVSLWWDDKDGEIRLVDAIESALLAAEAQGRAEERARCAEIARQEERDQRQRAFDARGTDAAVRLVALAHCANRIAEAIEALPDPAEVKV